MYKYIGLAHYLRSASNLRQLQRKVCRAAELLMFHNIMQGKLTCLLNIY
jgi:hypothetical protein